MTTIHSSINQHPGNAGSSRKTTHDEVARAAFSIYERHGSQDGEDVRNWLDAETQLMTKHANITHLKQATVQQSTH